MVLVCVKFYLVSVISSPTVPNTSAPPSSFLSLLDSVTITTSSLTSNYCKTLTLLQTPRDHEGNSRPYVDKEPKYRMGTKVHIEVLSEGVTLAWPFPETRNVGFLGPICVVG